MVTFNKTTSAKSYAWSGCGSSSVACKYDVVVNGDVVGTISRDFGGGYMEPTRWVARSTTDRTMVLASYPTLKAVKERLIAKFA